MTISKDTVAIRIADYLHRRIRLAELVDWAEGVLMEGEFTEADAPVLSDVVARLGVADVRSFGLTWEDCEDLLGRLGYTAKVEVVAA